MYFKLYICYRNSELMYVKVLTVMLLPSQFFFINYVVRLIFLKSYNDVYTMAQFNERYFIKNIIYYVLKPKVSSVVLTLRQSPRDILTPQKNQI